MNEEHFASCLVADYHFENLGQLFGSFALKKYFDTSPDEWYISWKERQVVRTITIASLYFIDTKLFIPKDTRVKVCSEPGNQYIEIIR